MDPLIHTAIATGLLAGAYYVGRYLGWRNGVNIGYTVGVHRAKMEGELKALFEDIEREIEEQQHDDQD